MLDWQGCTRAHVCAAPPTMVMLISSAPHWIEGESVGTVMGVHTQRALVLSDHCKRVRQVVPALQAVQTLV